MAHRIAILWHERQQPEAISAYGISWYADTWRAAGFEVIDIFGVDKHVPADLVIVHVDVSVVPDRYLRFARQYPLVLNGRLRDIRKSAYSELRLMRTSEYTGRVIVKTNRNPGGRPDRPLALFPPLRQGPGRLQRRRTMQWTGGRAPSHIYAQPRDVPQRYFLDRRYI